MKKVLLAIGFFLFVLVANAGELTGKYKSEKVSMTLQEEGHIVSGTLLVEDIIYKIDGKAADGVAYVDVLDNTGFLVSSLEITLSNGELVVKTTSAPRPIIPASVKLLKE